MATLPKQMPSKPKEQPVAEPTVGMCIAVVELGFQKETTGNYCKASDGDLQYDGFKVKPKVVPVFEIDQQLTSGPDEGKNFQLSPSNFGVDLSAKDKSRFTLGFWHKGVAGKALAEGEDYTANMVGKLCTLTLEEGKNGYVNVTAASPLPAKMKVEFKPNRIQYIDGKAPAGFEGVEEYKPHEALQNTIDSALTVPKLIEANKANKPLVEWLQAIELGE